MTILDELAAYAKVRCESAKEKVSAEKIKELACSLPKKNFEFEKALKKDGISFICECKKASPSKGLIAPDFPYLEIAKEYEAAGADCISVLTEPKWFLGSDEYLKEIAKAVSTPCIRKDFTVDEYMIYEAHVLGACAVLLICSILDEDKIREYIKICDSLGLSALVEAHNEEEIKMALAAGARIVGVNNRNLKDFSVDTENSRKLRELIPKDVIFVSESGIKDRNDVKQLEEIGADAVLIGETLMRADDKTAILAYLRGAGMTKVKFCGLKRDEDILFANETKPDFIGFVFAKKSKRYVSFEKAAQLKSRLSKDITAVGVFVDEDESNVAMLLNENVIDIAQLHGSEDGSYIKRLRLLTDKPIIKAFCVKDKSDIEKAKESEADYILLDSSSAGSGQSFDWSLLENVGREYFLAGGLDTENIKTVMKEISPFAVDVSSGIETDGIKDITKMHSFVKSVRERI